MAAGEAAKDLYHMVGQEQEPKGAVKGLTEKLFEEGVEWPPELGCFFYPNGVIDRIATRDEIRAELIRCYGNHMEGLDEYTKNIFERGRRLFIILLLASLEHRGRPYSICNLLD